MALNAHNLVNLGFTDEQVVEIQQKLPVLFKLSLEKLQAIFICFLESGFTKEQTIKVLVQVPAILKENPQEINKQIKLYKELLGKKTSALLAAHPDKILKGFNNTYARFVYLQKIGLSRPEIEKNLFNTKDFFIKTYNVLL